MLRRSSMLSGRMPGMHLIKAEKIKHELSFSGSLWLPVLPGRLTDSGFIA
ncbi:MAG: hypothetical protein ACLFN1_03515 [Bacteroidales bacterium]